MATFLSSQQKQVPAKQGPNAAEDLLTGKKPGPSGQPQQAGKRGKTGRLAVCPGMSIPAEREPGLESRGTFPFSCLVWSFSDRKQGQSFHLGVKHEAWKQAHSYCEGVLAKTITVFLHLLAVL